MSTTIPFTADELLKLPMGMGKCYELVAGELIVMSPGGWRHGSVISNLHVALGSFVRQHDLGVLFGAETGFQLARNPDTVRAPDIAFIAKQNLPTEMPDQAFWPGAPNLAVEVLSPDDRSGKIREKIDGWLASGTEMVWIVDPKLRIVSTYERGRQPYTRSAGEVLEGDPVVPGFSCPVDEIFR
jgi:Uma2 family endonuclease